MAMKTKTRVSLFSLVLVMLLLALVTPVLAGGWVVITLDSLPSNVVAGQPFEIGFTALQHGATPWVSPAIRIEAKHIQTGQTAAFTAKLDTVLTGHYKAELVFPQPGQWEWGIQSGLYPDTQPMPPIEVASSAASAAPAAPPASALPWAFIAIAALLILAAAAALLLRQRRQKLLSLPGIGLLVAVALLVFVIYSYASAQAVPSSQASSSAPALASDLETGRQLFLAKGCVVCHVNDRALKNSEEYSISAGLNLSYYRNDPEFLSQFLADPKPRNSASTIKMPNLGLSPEEIDALVLFINEAP